LGSCALVHSFAPPTVFLVLQVHPVGASLVFLPVCDRQVFLPSTGLMGLRFSSVLRRSSH
jgi:hypothetical protein